MNKIICLCVIMQFKHFIADYPLQNAYMLGKFKKNGWVLPLLAHCGVHFAFTLVIAWVASNSFNVGLILAFLDLSIHFIMDRIKASPTLLGKFEALSKGEFKGVVESLALVQAGLSYPNFDIADQSQIEHTRLMKRIKSNTYFWYALGFDQLVHHLTDLLVIYIIMSNI